MTCKHNITTQIKNKFVFDEDNNHTVTKTVTLCCKKCGTYWYGDLSSAKEYTKEEYANLNVGDVVAPTPS